MASSRCSFPVRGSSRPVSRARRGSVAEPPRAQPDPRGKVDAGEDGLGILVVACGRPWSRVRPAGPRHPPVRGWGSQAVQGPEPAWDPGPGRARAQPPSHAAPSTPLRAQKAGDVTAQPCQMLWARDPGRLDRRDWRDCLSPGERRSAEGEMPSRRGFGRPLSNLPRAVMPRARTRMPVRCGS